MQNLPKKKPTNGAPLKELTQLLFELLSKLLKLDPLATPRACKHKPLLEIQNLAKFTHFEKCIFIQQ
jgi:hypothetical protein